MKTGLSTEFNLLADEEIIICAFRYAIGRRTYVVLDISNYLTKNVLKFSDYFLEKISQEIQEEYDFRQRSGQKLADSEIWFDVKKVFENELEIRRQQDEM